MVHLPTTVVPGDRRETRDSCLNLVRTCSGMDPGSSLRCAQDDRADEREVQQ